jgi:hypothetical protein
VTDVRLRDIAARQDGVVARWQLIASGASVKAANLAVAELRALHDGVYVTGWGPATERQQMWAAVLTAPSTVLSHASAAALWGLRPAPRVATVSRTGSHGREHQDRLLVLYSSTLAGNVTHLDGIPITTVERTIIDLWSHLGLRAREKLLREALRLRLTTGPAMLLAIRRHRGRRGVATLRVAVEGLSALQLHRCKSDAEAFAVVVTADAERPAPLINEEVAGEEADLYWPEWNLIIELDGPQWHRLRDEDIRKQRVWEAAGLTVRRLPTDRLFADTSTYLALAHPPNVRRVAA